MTPFFISLILLSVATAQDQDYSIADQELANPHCASSSNGLLRTSLVVDQFRYEGVPATRGERGTGSFWTRVFNNSLPGPCLRFRAGDIVEVDLYNNLQFPDSDGDGGYKNPNTTNFHTHGLHVTPREPGDSILVHVPPQGKYSYRYDIPSDHVAGTNWGHAHHHGSTSLQAGGGLALAIIVDDEPGSLPDEVLSLEEKILLIQEIPSGGNGDTLLSIAQASGDLLVTNNPIFPTRTYTLINGFYKPRITLDQGKWYRLRSIYSSIASMIAWDVQGCELRLLAKDGVYLNDAPRALDPNLLGVYMAAGNRADVAIRCDTPGTFPLTRTNPQNPTTNTMIANVVVTANNDAIEPELPDLNAIMPDYLTSLVGTLPASVPVETQTHRFNGSPDGCTVNGAVFDMDTPNYVGTVGTVQEWTLPNVNAHPLHIHVGQYQIVQGSSTYHQIGDWLDVLRDPTSTTATVIRFQTDRFAGPYILHCHILVHEDLGCMGWMDVQGEDGVLGPMPIVPSASPTLPASRSSVPTPSVAPSPTPTTSLPASVTASPSLPASVTASPSLPASVTASPSLPASVTASPSLPASATATRSAVPTPAITPTPAVTPTPSGVVCTRLQDRPTGFCYANCVPYPADNRCWQCDCSSWSDWPQPLTCTSTSSRWTDHRCQISCNSGADCSRCDCS